MNQCLTRWVVAVAVTVPAITSVVCAEESPKALPTLLIKGEVVSVDTNDPTASLLKVKDRYGFETPIYVTPETKIARGEQAVSLEELQSGTAVEVEYNFDINTAKRHAAAIELSVPVAATPPAAPVTSPEAVATPLEIPVAPIEKATPATEQPAAGSSGMSEHPGQEVSGQEHPGEPVPESTN